MFQILAHDASVVRQAGEIYYSGSVIQQMSNRDFVTGIGRVFRYIFCQWGIEVQFAVFDQQQYGRPR